MIGVQKIRWLLIAIGVALPLFVLAETNSLATVCAALFDLPPNTIAQNTGGVMTPEICEAYTFLMRYTKLDKTRITCLNPQFAVNLKNLMSEAPGGPPQITDAYRTPAEQNRLSPGSTQVGACGSYHQYGMAADFNAAAPQVQRWLRENASKYNLGPVTNANPTSGCTPRGFCDGGHIQMGGSLPPRNQCGVCSPRGAMTAGGHMHPGTSPSQGVAQSVRNYLNPQPQQPQIPQQTLPASNDPLNYLQASTSVSENINVTTNVNTSTSTAAIDLIVALGGATTTQSATGTVLGFGGTTTVSLIGAQQGGDTSGTVFAHLPSSQQTFTSEDLRNSSGTYIGTNSTWGVLEGMRQALLRAINFLRPFGSASVNSATAYME